MLTHPYNLNRLAGNVWGLTYTGQYSRRIEISELVSFVCFLRLRLNVLVNNFKVISGSFLGMNQYLLGNEDEVYFLLKGKYRGPV